MEMFPPGKNVSRRRPPEPPVCHAMQIQFLMSALVQFEAMSENRRAMIDCTRRVASSRWHDRRRRHVLLDTHGGRRGVVLRDLLWPS